MSAQNTYAADGKTVVYNIAGYPLMVRAVDFNAAIAAQEVTHAEVWDSDVGDWCKRELRTPLYAVGAAVYKATK